MVDSIDWRKAYNYLQSKDDHWKRADTKTEKKKKTQTPSVPFQKRFPGHNELNFAPLDFAPLKYQLLTQQNNLEKNAH